MTNQEMIQDLKQFIEATVAQQTTQLEQRMDRFDGRMTGLETNIKSVAADVARLDEKLDAVQGAIAETITHAVEAIDTTKQVTDLETRVLRLEQRAA